MGKVTLDDRGRLTIPKQIRERFGDHYRIVEQNHGIKLIPVSDTPLEDLRDEFAEVDLSSKDLRERAREQALDDAGT